MAKKTVSKKNMETRIPKRRGRPPGSGKKKMIVPAQMELPLEMPPVKPTKVTLPLEFVENLMESIFVLSQEVRRMSSIVEKVDYAATRRALQGGAV